jgi:hypothetical protein
VKIVRPNRPFWLLVWATAASALVVVATPAIPAPPTTPSADLEDEQRLAERLATLLQVPSVHDVEDSVAVDELIDRFLATDLKEPLPRRAGPLRRDLFEHLRGIRHDRSPFSGELSPEIRRVRLTAAARVADHLALKLGLESDGDRPTALSRIVAAPPNDACADALPLEEDAPVQGATTGATQDGAASCGSSASSPDVWYRYEAPADGLVTFETFGSPYDTVLSLHSSCPATVLNELACSDDADGTLQSQIPLVMLANEAVYVRVSGAGGATGAYDLVAKTGGGIGGNVEKESTGEPLAGTYVTLYDSFGSYLRFTTTAFDGSYLFGGLDGGAYFVVAGRQGYVEEVYDDVPCVPYCDLEGTGTPVIVTTTLVTDIDLALSPAGAITGTVTSADDGAPLSGLSVLARSTSAPAMTYAFYDFTSYPSAQYHLEGLPPDSYLVWTNGWYLHAGEAFDEVLCNPDCEAVLASATPLEVGAGSAAALDFSLEPLGAIAGEVRDQQFELIPYVVVTLYRPDGSTASSVTAYNGTYTAPLLPGTYYARASSAEVLGELYGGMLCDPSCDPTDGTPIQVALGLRTSGIDFQLSRRGRITGSVRDAETHQALSNGYVYVYDESGEEVASSYISNGNYTASGLTPGTYRARVVEWGEEYQSELFDDHPCDPDCDVLSGSPIPVQLDTITSGVDFDLERCSLPSIETVAGELLLGSELREACSEVLLGPNTTLLPGSELDVAARRSIRIRATFKVSLGSQLRVRIDPTVGTP